MTAQSKVGNGQAGADLLDGGARFARRPGLFSRLSAPGFHTFVDRIERGLEQGSIIGHLPDGTTRHLGGRAPGFEAEITINDWRALLRVAAQGSIGLYQGWAAGEWHSDDPVALFALFMANAGALGDTARAKGGARFAGRLAHWLNRNTRAGSRRNIHAHYDLGNAFYAAWLDPTMSYSSGLFGSGDTLEQSQKRKWDALDKRLGQAGSVLEIGCGWGALAGHLADSGRDVTAISLSDAQLEWARAHHPAVEFRKQDYRDVSGPFDAIVSVEMVEALGRAYWPQFMDCIARNLKPGGRAAIQFISMRDDLFDAYARNADFIQAYVFPGGMLIRTSEFRHLAEARGLEWRDQHDFGQDYAETLRLWREGFEAALSAGELPPEYDERFCDLWRYYLMYCEGGFRSGGIDVHQVTLVKGSE